MSDIIRKCVIVKELQDNIVIDGLLQKYDDSSPFMFGVIIDGNKEVLNSLYAKANNYGGKTVISFFRVNKTPYLGNYLVDADNIIEVMTAEEYEKRKVGEK